VDTSRKRIVLVARFDESKGMDKAMKLGCDVRKILRESGCKADELPQIVLVGNGSVDDPSGIPMYEEMLRLRREQFSNDKEDIVIMRLRHNYTAMNALMYPTGGLDGDDTAQIVGIQTSEAEGCETRISDWIRHGVPAVVFNNGGMPLQVQEGVSGYILDYQKEDHDMQRGAKIISELMRDPKEYARLRVSSQKAGNEFNDREFTTTANVTRIARTIGRSIEGKAADKVWKISNMIY
jgi:glycosyltransferase involved in cell wall biosynthesis